MKTIRAVTLIAALVQACLAQVPTTFFGMHQNLTTDPWPSSSVPGSERIWDAFGANRPAINTAKGVYNWTALDTFLWNAKRDGIQDVLYTLSSTPTWASQRGSRCTGAGKPDAGCTGPADKTCDYGNFGAGVCYSNADLAADGTGTDQTWKDWVTAVTKHVDGLGPNYAHVHAWEIWNEIYRGSLAPGLVTGGYSWQGTYDQLIRMAQDARAIIKAIDPAALIVSPSSQLGPTPNKVLANFLYCNQAPATRCTKGIAGSQAVDVVATHAYEDKGMPELMDPNMKTQMAMLSANDKAKPFWMTEGGWGVDANLPKSADQVAFVARWWVFMLAHNVSRAYWYGYDFQNGGTLWSSTTKELTAAGIAAATVQKWLVGQSWHGCMTFGTVTRCGVGSSTIIWDSAGNSMYPTAMSKYQDLTGNTKAIVGGKVAISPQPILLIGPLVN